MHIPIKDYSYFDENPSDAVVIFAWNHFKEILEKKTQREILILNGFPILMKNLFFLELVMIPLSIHKLKI